MRTITVEELDIIVQASVEQALSEFKKIVPQIKKTMKEAQNEIDKLNINEKSFNESTKEIQKQINNIDTKKIKNEVQQAAKTVEKAYINAFKSTEKQQELLYEKIKQKQEELANLKTNGMPISSSNEEINARIKQTGKIPILIEKTDILEIEAEIEKLNNKLLDLQKAEQKLNQETEQAFDPNNTNGLTIQMNAFKLASKEISGIANNMKNYSAKMGVVGEAFEKLRNKMKQTTKETDDSIDSNIKKLSGYKKELDDLYKLWGQDKVSLADIQQFKASKNAGTENTDIIDTSDVNAPDTNVWDILKQKIAQIKPVVEQYKQALSNNSDSKQLELVKYQISEIEEKLKQAEEGKIRLGTEEIVKAEAELERLNSKKEKLEQGGKNNVFTKILSSIKQSLPNMDKMKKNYNQILKISTKVVAKVKQMGTNFKQGLSTVLKYAGALFSLQTIYSILSNSASSWLSSQNEAAQQLTTNIEYMQYALGSVFAPVIEYIVNLAYQLMKAIQSIVYALTGINIFANASAKSYASMASSASDAADSAEEQNKQLAGVHDEINNVNSSNDSSSSSSSGSSMPSFDLSTVENMDSSILEAIKNGNWYAVGAEIGKKINEALDSIDWSSIQSKAQKIATNIGDFINGFVDGLDWNLLGITIGEGINTAFIFANTLLTRINWGNIGTSIANFLNSSISTIKWDVIGQTFANILNAIINYGYNFVTTFQWTSFGTAIGNAVSNFINNIEWDKAGQLLGSGIIGIFNSITGFLNEVDWQSLGEGVKTFIQNIDWVGIWDAIKETIKSAFGSVDEFLTGLFGENTATVIESIAGAVATLVVAFKGFEAVQSIVTTFKSLSDTTTLLGSAFSFLTSPIGLVVLAIAGLVAAGIYLYQNFETVRDIVNGAIETIKETFVSLYEEHIKPLIDNIVELLQVLWNDVLQPLVSWFVENILPVLVPIFESLWTTISSVFGSIIDVISGVIETFSGVIEYIVGIFTGDWEMAWQGICDFFSGIWDTIKGIIETVWNAISGIIETTINIIAGIVDTVFITIATIISNIWNGILDFISTVWNAILSTISTVINNVKNTISNILNSISSTWNSTWNSIKTTVTNIWNSIWSSIKSVINSILAGIESFVNGIISGINTVLSGISSVANAVGSLIGLNPINLQLSTISLPRLAKGAVLTVPTVAEMAEYPGASSNPEIVTPQNIMEETFDRVLSRYLDDDNDNNQPVYLTVNVGNEKLGQVLLDNLRDKVRRSGKGIEALVGG